MSSKSDIDLPQVTEWFTTLYGSAYGYLHVACSNNWVGRFFDLRHGLDQAALHVERLGRTNTTGIYARVTTLRHPPEKREHRGGIELTASVPALWADIDLQGPGHRHESCQGGTSCQHSTFHPNEVLPLPPGEVVARFIVDDSWLPPATLWIHSGGGLYPIWLVDPAHHIRNDLGLVRMVSAGWQRVIARSAKRAGFHYGAGVGDLARVLRVPGTWNRKTSTARPCIVLANETMPRYSFTDLIAGLAHAQSQLPPEPKPLPRSPVVPTHRSGEVRPGEDFAARVDWSDQHYLLGRLGWEVVLRRGTYREWLRPNASPTSTLSATTGRGDGDNLFVFSTNTPFPTETPITKLEAFRIIHGYVTHGDAVRALGKMGFGSPPMRQAIDPSVQAPLQWPDGSTTVRP